MKQAELAQEARAMGAIGGRLALLLVGHEVQGGGDVERGQRQHGPSQETDVGQAQHDGSRAQVVKRRGRVQAHGRVQVRGEPRRPPLSGSDAAASEPGRGAPR